MSRPAPGTVQILFLFFRTLQPHSLRALGLVPEAGQASFLWAPLLGYLRAFRDKTGYHRAQSGHLHRGSPLPTCPLKIFCGDEESIPVASTACGMSLLASREEASPSLADAWLVVPLLQRAIPCLPGMLGSLPGQCQVLPHPQTDFPGVLSFGSAQTLTQGCFQHRSEAELNAEGSVLSWGQRA